MQRAEQETPSPPLQEGWRFSEPDAASSQAEAQALSKAEKRTADWLIVSTQIEAISENPPLAPSSDQPKIRTEEHIPPSSSGRRKVGLLLGAFLLIVGAAALGAIAAGLLFVLALTFFFG
jgi:ferric-dicitrate binding protein FerR (iron transport regulator)